MDDENSLKSLALQYLNTIQPQIYAMTASKEVIPAIKNIKQVLLQYPDLSMYINLNLIKTSGFLYAFTDFVDLLVHLSLFENYLNSIKELLCDKKVMLFLALKISKFVEEEHQNYEPNEENKNIVSNKNINSQINYDHKNELSQSETNMRFSENMDDVRQEDLTKETYNIEIKNNTHLFIDYIENDDIRNLFILFENVFKIENKTALLQIFVEIGIFDLFSIIVTREITSILENIFKYKVFPKKEENKSYQEIKKSKIYNSTLPIYQINRKFFDPEVVVREKKWIIIKKIESTYKFEMQKIYLEVVLDFFDRNIFYFISECGIKSLVHSINFYISHIITKKINFNKIKTLMSIIYCDDNIRTIQSSIISENKLEEIRLYKNFLKFSTHSFVENKMVLFDRLLMNTDFNKKISKNILEVKNKEIFNELIIMTYFYMKSIESFNNQTIKKIDENIALGSIINELGIKKIVELLSYDFHGKTYIIKLLKSLYFKQFFNKLLLYKPSYLVIFRNVVYEKDKQFSITYFNEIMAYFNHNIRNMVRVFFKTSEKRKNIVCESGSESNDTFEKITGDNEDDLQSNDFENYFSLPVDDLTLDMAYKENKIESGNNKIESNLQPNYISKDKVYNEPKNMDDELCSIIPKNNFNEKHMLAGSKNENFENKIMQKRSTKKFVLDSSDEEIQNSISSNIAKINEKVSNVENKENFVKSNEKEDDDSDIFSLDGIESDLNMDW